ncbi:MAG: hypothetical protein NZL95_02495 [Chitinophagales bacterium]|nr:hypothetical protein [Chitinophagales bacterium]MDW8427402.1 hypothetical protein [Chitinophagales bacterium]
MRNLAGLSFRELAVKHRVWLLSFALCSVCFKAHAQLIDTSSLSVRLSALEDSLRPLADSMVLAADQLTRQNACYAFIPMLVRALKHEGSFQYPFSRLRTVSILYAEDKSFRIFSWAVRFDDETYRYYGAIQLNEPQLRLFPLYDARSLIRRLADTVTDHRRWPGALYYNLKSFTTAGGKTYHLLFGWDGHTAQSNRKFIEVLTFSRGKPVFGASIFDFGPQDPRNRIKRFFIEYKENASVTLNYDADLNMIVFDHLQPETPQLKGDYRYYIPDGTYEGFQWQGNKLRYLSEVFTTTQAEPPFERPIDFSKRRKWYEPK